MMIFRKSLPRRTFLRAVGASVGLPLLDAMIPALKADRGTAAAPVRRMGIVFVPNAVILDRWLPTKVGADFEFKPIMSPLAPFREKLLVLSGLSCEPDKAQVDDHARALAGWLTGVELRKPDMSVGISADQIAAQELGKQTQFASLELAAEQMPTGISYKAPTTPLPVETNPRVLFERLFGDGDSIDPKAMAAHNREDQSILDLVREDISGLSRKLGAGDRRKLDEYLESIRDIERRIEIAEQRMSNVEVPEIRRPAGVPDLYPDYVKLMFDLQVVALQADLTRVWTFMLGREASVMTYNHIGIPDAHHEITHHAGHQDKIEGVTKINTRTTWIYSAICSVRCRRRKREMDHSSTIHWCFTAAI